LSGKVKFKRKIRRSGASPAITLPNEVLEAVGLKMGDRVNIYVEKSRVVIDKAS